MLQEGLAVLAVKPRLRLLRSLLTLAFQIAKAGRNLCRNTSCLSAIRWLLQRSGRIAKAATCSAPAGWWAAALGPPPAGP
jgi:hypothetical protein